MEPAVSTELQRRRAGPFDKEQIMPAPTSKTITINAAFLQEIKEDHRELREVLVRVKEHLTQNSLASSTRPLLEMLHSLRDRLAMHFALEEAYGYYEDAISVAPQLSSRAEQLRGEHTHLFLQVQQLVEDAEQVLYHETNPKQLNGMPAKFGEFMAQFETHEHRECALIHEAYERDLGTGG
jgi:predicted ATPase